MTKKSYQHIAGANVNIHMKYEVSIIMFVSRRANQLKVPKWLPFENYKSEQQQKSNQHTVGAYVHIYNK